MTRPITHLPKGPAQNQANYVAAVGAQGHAHANLTGAPLYRVCRDAVKTDGSEHQRKQPKEPGHLRHRTLLIERAVDLLLHRLNIDDGQIGIDFAEGLADERFDPHRASAQLQHGAADVVRAVVDQGHDRLIID